MPTAWIGWVVWLGGQAGGSVASPPSSPLPVVGGEDVGVCEWPSTVAFVQFGSQYCSGTLVHPELVLTAAHCLHPGSGWGEPSAIVFGEDFEDPARQVTHTECALHPMYDHDAVLHSPEDAWDLAWCRLSEPVTDVPVTPLLTGCEADALTPGTEVHIVGFGASEIMGDGGGGFTIAGNGIKRHALQSFESVDAAGQIFLVGDGTASACSGDSGGSGYVQLEDGSWRAVGAISRVHPDAPAQEPWCVYGVVVTGATAELEWLESSSGLDLTACHDADGTWAPTAACDAFPTDPVAVADWIDGCGTQPVSGLGASCGPAFGEDPGGTGTDSGGDDSGGSDTGDDAGETTGDDAAVDGSGTTGDAATGDGGGSTAGSTGAEPAPPTDDTGPDTADTGDGTGDPELDASDDAGCGCASDRGPAPVLAWLVPLALLGRRRRQ